MLLKLRLCIGWVGLWRQLPAIVLAAVYLLLFCLSPSHANTAPQVSPTLPSLFASSQVLPLDQPLQVRLQPRDISTTVNDVAALPPSQWEPVREAGALPTNNTQDVWLRLALPQTASPQTWMLRIPRSSLQKATLYQRSITGPSWHIQSAGQDVAHQSWPLRSRDPVFELSTHPDRVQVYFVRLEHRMPVTESIQLIRSGDFANGANLVGTLQGLIMGLFGLLTLVSLVSAKIIRSRHFAWFGLFVFSVLLAHLAVSGYLMVRVWPQSVFLTQTMIWVLPLLSLTALARFALSVSYAKELSQPIYYTLWAVLGISALLSAMVMLLPSNYAREPLNILYALGMLAVLVALSWIAWRSQPWLWLLVLSLIPVGFSVLVRLAYNLGWFAHVEQAMLAAVITTSLGLLVTFAALVMHHREGLSVSRQHDELETRDASTGLFSAHIALTRFPQIILRSKRFGQPCGAIMVRWLDMNSVIQQTSSTDRGRIFSHLGSRLGRLVRDIDTVARMDDDLFVFLVESPVTREQLIALASKILTTCMRPSAVMPDQKGFDLHLALWLSDETHAEAAEVIELMKTRINHMGEGTQRRVQFVDTQLTTGSPPGALGSDMAQQLVNKINALEASQGLPRVSLPDRKTS